MNMLSALWGQRAKGGQGGVLVGWMCNLPSSYILAILN